MPTSAASAITQTLAYAQVFNFPLSASEISRWLISSSQASELISESSSAQFFPSGPMNSPEYVEYIIHSHLSRMCNYHHGYYFLKSTPQQKVPARLNSLNYTQQKIATARKLIPYFRYIPSIELVAVTGSVAASNAQADDDIDLMIVTSPGTLWTTRIQVIAILDFLGVRRHPGQQAVKDYICTNLYLDADHVQMVPAKRDLYIAHEILQAIPIFERHHTYKKFLLANQWTSQFLPNAWEYANKHLLSLIESSSLEASTPSTSHFKYLLKPIESFSYYAQRAYMAPKHTTESISSTAAYFHPRDYRTWVNQTYQQHLHQFSQQ